MWSSQNMVVGNRGGEGRGVEISTGLGRVAACNTLEAGRGCLTIQETIGCVDCLTTIIQRFMKYFKAIAAMSENRVIGQGNKIPWHLPEDFKWFKKMTTGQVVVMGRKTFESIGRPLPNRETIIVSRNQYQYPGVRTISSLSEIDLEKESREVFICGGAQIYEQALAQCSDLYLTLVKRTVDGDAFFPTFENRFQKVETVVDVPEFSIVHFRNVDIGPGGIAK